VQRDDVAGRHLPPERGEHARADTRLLAERERQAISERVRDAYGEGDLRVERQSFPRGGRGLLLKWRSLHGGIT
jgi:hypothetical protein